MQQQFRSKIGERIKVFLRLDNAAIRNQPSRQVQGIDLRRQSSRERSRRGHLPLRRQPQLPPLQRRVIRHRLNDGDNVCYALTKQRPAQDHGGPGVILLLRMRPGIPGGAAAKLRRQIADAPHVRHAHRIPLQRQLLVQLAFMPRPAAPVRFDKNQNGLGRILPARQKHPGGYPHFGIRIHFPSFHIHAARGNPPQHSGPQSRRRTGHAQKCVQGRGKFLRRMLLVQLERRLAAERSHHIPRRRNPQRLIGLRLHQRFLQHRLRLPLQPRAEKAVQLPPRIV